MNEKFLDGVKRLIEEYGEEVLQNIQRTRGLLLDLAPNMKPESLLFTNLLSINGYKEVKNMDESGFYRLLEKLEAYYFIKRTSAAWIINVLSKALNGTVYEIQEVEEVHNAKPVLRMVKEVEECEHVIALGTKHTVAICKDGNLIATGRNDMGQCDVTGISEVAEVHAGEFYTVVVTGERKVVIIGDFDKGESENWENIKQVVATEKLLLALDTEGNLLAAGENANQFEEGSEWKQLTQIAAQSNLVAGIKDTGKVITNSEYINISHWRDIVSIEVSNSHIVGLCKDGTVMAAGRNNFLQCEVENWEDIIQISVGETNEPIVESAKKQLEAAHEEISRIFAKDDRVMLKLDRISQLKEEIIQDFESLENASSMCISDLEEEYRRMFLLLNNRDTTIAKKYKMVCKHLIHCINDIDKYEDCSASHTVGLKSDGSVVATGFNAFNQCDVENFSNVKSIMTSGFHTVALKHDRTVDICGSDRCNQHYVKNWKDVQLLKISKTGEYLVGLKIDGTLYNVGNDDVKQCRVDSWENIGVVEK